MADIQKKLIKWGKRNAVSRRLHAKNDKETIATWRLDLGEVLQVFNVRSVSEWRSFLTLRSQKELKPNTDVIVSTTPRDVVNTRTNVSDINRKGPENAHSQEWPVSAIYTLPGTERSLTTS